MKEIVRSLGVMSAAVAFGAGSALLAPAAGAQSLPTGSLGSVAPESCDVTETVTPSTQESAGWGTPGDETAAKIAKVTVDGNEEAALTFPIASPAVGTALYKNADRMPLADLLGEDRALKMEFDYVTDGQAPALQIRLHEASLSGTEENAPGYDLGFATIVWSPENGNLEN